jgi:ribokinase
MSIAVFVCGGVIIDNVVAADGALARDLVGGNAVYAAMGASHWLDQVGIVARVPRTYPADAFTALHGSGLDLGGLVVEPVDVTRSEWFFHRADGSRVDHLHATAEQADAFGMTGERVPIEQAQRFQTRLEQATEAGGDYKAFRAAHPVTADQVPTGYWRARGVHLAPNAPAAQLTLARQARRQAPGSSPRARAGSRGRGARARRQHG